MALEIEYLAARPAERATVTDAELQALQMYFVQMILVFLFTIVAILAIKTVISKMVRTMCDRKARAGDHDEPSTSS
ncbi:hypothetical protein [uncultured Brevundimonas sp.]|uniref:hypothetical protein n=1 Tax=uncultured Brevundimonas sp. TaxID=213418 RepID=UPI0025F80D80|nr:hypothetical protein [uncultured Brevundimonas sp.]